MSCQPQCPVPNFLFPKKQGTDQENTDCIERCKGPQCTAYKLYAIQPQSEKCVNAELAELLRCHACQEQRLKRLIDKKKIAHECYLKKLACQYPEIPLAGRPEQRHHPRFIRHGYIVEDCFPENVLHNACQQRAAWKKKVKAWIKDLSDHYNKKVMDSTEKPIDDYIRLNMQHQCLSCQANENQKSMGDIKCGDKIPDRPRCMMVAGNCGKCVDEKMEPEPKKKRCDNWGEVQLPHGRCKLE